jgi:DNA replicative helicase MCM subunit Mcm2 (Cdc46/Mcm family)
MTTTMEEGNAKPKICIYMKDEWEKSNNTPIDSNNLDELVERLENDTNGRFPPLLNTLAAYSETFAELSPVDDGKYKPIGEYESNYGHYLYRLVRFKCRVYAVKKRRVLRISFTNVCEKCKIPLFITYPFGICDTLTLRCPSCQYSFTHSSSLQTADCSYVPILEILLASPNSKIGASNLIRAVLPYYDRTPLFNSFCDGAHAFVAGYLIEDRQSDKIIKRSKSKQHHQFVGVNVAFYIVNYWTVVSPEKRKRILQPHSTCELLSLLLKNFAPHITSRCFEKLLFLLCLASVINDEENVTGRRKLGLTAGMRRRTLHLLMIGNPGSGKTSLENEMCSAWDRNVLIDAASTTGAGLVAASSSSSEREDTMMTGRLTGANGGVVIVDEIDKNPHLFDYFIEPMYHQSISVQKAGITAEYECSISCIMACNPRRPSHRYDYALTVEKNLAGNDYWLDFFDMIFVMPAIPNETIMEVEFAPANSPRQTSNCCAWLSTNPTLKGFHDHYLKHMDDEVSKIDFQYLVSFVAHRPVPFVSKETYDQLTNYYLKLCEKKAPFATPNYLASLLRIMIAIARLVGHVQCTIEDLQISTAIAETLKLSTVSPLATPRSPSVGRGSGPTTLLKKFENYVITMAPNKKDISHDWLIQSASDLGISKSVAEDFIQKLNNVRNVLLCNGNRSYRLR